MDNKFYVSCEAAILLKEKGYNEKVDYMYDDGELTPIKTLTNAQIDRYYRTMYDGIEFYGVPTKAEAIDWLESKGIVVEAFYLRFEQEWFYDVFVLSTRESYTSHDLKSRLEAEDAAIIKALELL